MKLYFYTANTINGYCNKLGVVVTVSEAEEKQKTYQSVSGGFPNCFSRIRKDDIGKLLRDNVILTEPNFEYAKKIFVNAAEAKVNGARDHLKRAERELEILRESEE